MRSEVIFTSHEKRNFNIFHNFTILYYTPQSKEGPYLDHGETTNESTEKVYVTTLVTTMGLFKYVDGGNSKITPKK